MILDPLKRVASLLDDVKGTSGKACLNERWKLALKKIITYEIIMQENQISHVFRNFPVYERH